MRHDLRLVGGFDVLVGKLKAVVQDGLSDPRVDLGDPNVMCKF